MVRNPGSARVLRDLFGHKFEPPFCSDLGGRLRCVREPDLLQGRARQREVRLVRQHEWARAVRVPWLLQESGEWQGVRAGIRRLRERLADGGGHAAHDNDDRQ